MKFAAFNVDGAVKIALVDDKEETVRFIEPPCKDMTALMTLPPTELRLSLGAPVRLATLDFAPPLRPTRNVFCVGKNYREHAREFNQSGFDSTSAGATADVDDFAAIFTKPPSCLIGHNAAIDGHPDVTSQLDYEAELAVVIGKEAKRVRRADALQYVWGYSIINDITARDLQRSHRQWFMGKALDTFCPMGPWVTTADEVDCSDMSVKCWVNGELRQNASTRDLIFDIPSLIETLSAGIRLMPGDVIATGTPAGVGIGFKPPRFLKPQDRIEIAITGLGRLENVVAKPREPGASR